MCCCILQLHIAGYCFDVVTALSAGTADSRAGVVQADAC